MKWPILIFFVLLCAVGWWFGIVTGAATALLAAGVLILARHVAGRFDPPGALAAMPVWQLLLVPVVSLPIGFGLGLIAYVVGPGF